MNLIVWSGGQRSLGVRQTVSVGGSVPALSTSTEVASVATWPLESWTLRVMQCTPAGRLIVGATPCALPESHVQSYVSESPSGSLDPEPSSCTCAPHMTT